MKINFLTFGCKVNQYETQALKEQFLSKGYVLSDDPDIFVINTCSVTYRADKKSLDAIMLIKRKYPQAKIIVTGCLAQLDKEKIQKYGVDFIIPQDKKHLLVDLITNSCIDPKKNIWSLKITEFFNQRAFLKIQDGCNFFCSFCKVPYIRGKSISRPPSDVLEEFTILAKKYNEIVLCGINLGLYGKDLVPSITLPELLHQILNLNLNSRIRLSSLEPYLITDDLINLFSEAKICPHVHLSFQSGDDKILKKMNKKETTELYVNLVNKLRKLNPLIAISCDIIVGFPDEDKITFENTINFLKVVRPMRMHIFTFSPRKPTVLANLKVKNQDEIYKRYIFLRNLASQFSLQYKQQCIGKIFNIIVEDKQNGYIYGYTENYIKVYVKENYPIGTLVPVEIISIDKDGKVFGKPL